MKARVFAYTGTSCRPHLPPIDLPNPLPIPQLRRALEVRRTEQIPGSTTFCAAGLQKDQPRTEVKGGGSGPKREMLRKGMVSREDWRQRLADVVQDPAQVT